MIEAIVDATEHFNKTAMMQMNRENAMSYYIVTKDNKCIRCNNLKKFLYYVNECSELDILYKECHSVGIVHTVFTETNLFNPVYITDDYVIDLDDDEGDTDDALDLGDADGGVIDLGDGTDAGNDDGLIENPSEGLGVVGLAESTTEEVEDVAVAQPLAMSVEIEEEDAVAEVASVTEIDLSEYEALYDEDAKTASKKALAAKVLEDFGITLNTNVVFDDMIAVLRAELLAMEASE